MNRTVDLTIEVMATGRCSLLLPLTDFSLVLLFLIVLVTAVSRRWTCRTGCPSPSG